MKPEPGPACPGCCGPTRPWSNKGGYALWICPSCRSVRATPQLEGTAPVADYAAYCDGPGSGPCPGAERSVAALVSSAEPYRRTGRWLDFGYGDGTLLLAAERAGWQCSGVEVARAALENGRRHHWDVHDALAAGKSLPAAGADVVSLVEVIEHLDDPEAALRACVGWLRPGGLLYLSTPNPTSLNARLLGARWSVFCPPEHVNYWSAAGMRATLRRAGLEPLRVRTHGLNPVEIRQSARRSGAPVNRQRAADALNQTLSSSSSRRRVKQLANAALAALEWGDTLKAWCEKPA